MQTHLMINFISMFDLVIHVSEQNLLFSLCVCLRVSNKHARLLRCQELARADARGRGAADVEKRTAEDKGGHCGCWMGYK